MRFDSIVALSLVLSVVAPAAAAFAAPPPPADVQALLDRRVAQAPQTGIIVGIVDGDETTVYKAGTAANAAPLDEHTEFEIGSVTKTFTATILASMVLDHTVDLHDPVQRYVPAGVHVPSRGGKQITLLTLATQHSGLPRLPANMAPKDPNDPYADYSFANLYAFLNGYTLPRDPGATFEYSNLGISLLGDALANRERASYGDLVRARVLAPLGMNQTFVVTPGARISRMATPHDADGVVVKPWTFTAIAPAGAISSDLADMLRYVRCNMGSGPLARACLFAQQPRDTFPGNRIGLVWWTGAMRSIVHHGGDTYGFHASVAISSDHRRGVVVLANGGGSVDGLAVHLIDAAVPFQQTTLPAEIALTSQQLDEYAGAYANGSTVYTIKREGDQLLAQISGQQFARIYPSAKDHFFYKVVDAQLDATRDANGKVNAFVLHQDGQKIVFVRSGMTVPTLPPESATSPPEVALDAATLDGYVGQYVAGAGAAFVIARTTDGISVQLTGQPAFPLYASAKDHFFLKVVEAQIEFQRDATGTITGLVLHQDGRVLTAARQ